MGNEREIPLTDPAPRPIPLVYVTGSLRNPRVPEVGNALRAAGFEAWDDWYAAGPEADDCWQRYEQARGRTYREALSGANAWHIFLYDVAWLRRADAGVVVLPAGKSTYAEMGYLRGRGKPVYVLMAEEPERWDVMLRFASRFYTDLERLIAGLQAWAESLKESA
jgi:nucleoside 2-deoxyribosyltransferase